MTKFTPGPWKAEHRKSANGMYNTEVFSEQHGVIAICNWTPKHCANGVVKTYREANARLIAAAPELYAACEEFVRKVECGEARSVRSYAQMKAALSKARGEEAADHA